MRRRIGPAAARALPPGTLAVGAGLVVYGLTAYGFLVVSARAVGPERYAGLSVLWAVVFLVALGFFVPLEREVARALAARCALGLGGAPVVRRAALLGGLGLAGVLAAVLAASPVLVHRLFDGEHLLLVGLVLSLSAYWLVHLLRGVLSGTERLAGYGRLLVAEGGVRLLACAGLALAGVSSAGPYGLALGLGPLAAVALVARRRDLGLGPGEAASWSELSVALSQLLAGTLLSQLLVNGPPVAVKLLASDAEQGLAGRFMAGVVAARVPLFLFAAVEVALLPTLARLAAQGDRERFRADLRRLLGVVAALGVSTSVGAFVVGPPLLRAFFGPAFSLGRADLALLAAANAAFLVAVTCAQALIALVRHGRIALGWGCGVAAFLVGLGVPGELLSRVELAFLAGTGVAAATMAGLVRAPLRGLRVSAGGVAVTPVLDVPGS